MTRLGRIIARQQLSEQTDRISRLLEAELKRRIIIDESAFEKGIAYGKILHLLCSEENYEVGGWMQLASYNVVSDFMVERGTVVAPMEATIGGKMGWHSHHTMGASFSPADNSTLQSTKSKIPVYRIEQLDGVYPRLNVIKEILLDSFDFNYGVVLAHIEPKYVSKVAIWKNRRVPVVSPVEIVFLPFNPDLRYTWKDLADELIENVSIASQVSGRGIPLSSIDSVAENFRRYEDGWAGRVITNEQIVNLIPVIERLPEQDNEYIPFLGIDNTQIIAKNELEQKIDRQIIELYEIQDQDQEQEEEQQDEDLQTQIRDADARNARLQYRLSRAEEAITRLAQQGRQQSQESQADLREADGILQDYNDVRQRNQELKQANTHIHAQLDAANARSTELGEQHEQEIERRVQGAIDDYEVSLSGQREYYKNRIARLNEAHRQELARLRRSPQITEPIVRAEVQNTYSSAEELADGIEQKVSALRQQQYSNYLLNCRMHKDGQILREAELNFSEFLNREYGKIKSVCSNFAGFTPDYKTECSEWCGKQLENTDNWVRVVGTDNPPGAAEIIERVSDMQATYINLRNILSG